MKNKWKTILITTPLLIATPLLLTTTISCNEKEEQQPHIQGTEEQQPQEPQEIKPFAYIDIWNYYSTSLDNKGDFVTWHSDYEFRVYTREAYTQKWEILETFWLDLYEVKHIDKIRRKILDIFINRFYIDRKDFITLKNIWKSLKFNYNNNENPYKN